MKLANHTFIFYLMLVLFSLNACELKTFDSEAIPVSDTFYYSAISPPDWIQNQGVIQIDLNTQFNLDSLHSMIRRDQFCGFEVLYLNNIIQGSMQQLETNSVFLVENMTVMDTLIGTQDKLISLLEFGASKNIKFILNWHGVYHLENSKLDSIKSFEKSKGENGLFVLSQNDKQLNNLVYSIEYFQKLGFNGIVCCDMDVLDPDFWLEIINETKVDSNFVWIGDSQDANWLNKSFHYLLHEKTSHSSTHSYQATYSDLRTIKHVGYEPLIEKDYFNSLALYRNHFLLNRAFNQSTFIVDYEESIFQTQYNDTLCLTMIRDLDQLNQLNSLYKNGVSTNMDIDQSLIVIRKNTEKEDFRLIINNHPESKSYYSSNAHIFKDLESDSSVALNLNLEPRTHRLIYYKE